MPIAVCRNCGKELPAKKGTCPHCGAAVFPASPIVAACAGFIVLALAVGVLDHQNVEKNQDRNAAANAAAGAVMAPDPPGPEDQAASTGTPVTETATQLAVADECQRIIKGSLRDPDAVAFVDSADRVAVEKLDSGHYRARLKLRTLSALGGKTESEFDCTLRPTVEEPRGPKDFVLQSLKQHALLRSLWRPIVRALMIPPLTARRMRAISKPWHTW